MITAALLERLACPVCHEPAGCERCGVARADHAACLLRYVERASCACGGPDKVALVREADALVCACCGVRYPVVGESHVDLVPQARLGDVTRYADHEFQERLGMHDGPPLLSARVKADMMRALLQPEPGEALVDLGCGAGKLAVYASRDAVSVTGVDIAPFFLASALREVALVRGDLRRLPFRRGAFAAGYSLDVLEHLDEPGVVELLREARHAVGRLFVYTHAMESSWLAGFQRAVNRFAKRLGKAGLVDHEREALRKSDHVNAIASHEHFETLCAQAGWRVVERRYYNVVFKAVVEDLLLRLLQQWRRRGGPSPAPHGHDHLETGTADPPAATPARVLPAPHPGPTTLAVGHVLTWLLKLDVALFGGIRTGPFFGLLRPLEREKP